MTCSLFKACNGKSIFFFFFHLFIKGDQESSRILYSKQSHNSTRSNSSPSESPCTPSSSSQSPHLPDPSSPPAPETPPAVTRAREFVAGIFRRAREASGIEHQDKGEKAGPSRQSPPQPAEPDSPVWHRAAGEGSAHKSNRTEEPSYVNYSRLRYVLGEVPESDRASGKSDGVLV